MKWDTRYVEKWIEEFDILNPWEMYQVMSGAHGKDYNFVERIFN